MIVGDPKQLPATIFSQKAGNYGLSKSLLERLMNDENKNHVMLNVQYRMRPAISSFPNKRFYESKLHDSAVVERMAPGGYTFVNVMGQERKNYAGSYQNIDEALMIISILRQLGCGKRNENFTGLSTKDTPWYSKNKIRIITFYQGQVTCIKNMLYQHGFGQISVATVDSSQGCEADIIIISFVRSNSKSKSTTRSKAGFLDDDRRINVALTRAKYQLICVGDVSHLLTCGVETLKTMIDDANERHLVCDHAELLRHDTIVQNDTTEETFSDIHIHESSNTSSVNQGPSQPTSPVMSICTTQNHTTVKTSSDHQPVSTASISQSQTMTNLLVSKQNPTPSASNNNIELRSKKSQELVQKLRSLQQQLPFAQTDLMLKKTIRTKMESLKKELQDLFTTNDSVSIKVQS